MVVDESGARDEGIAMVTAILSILVTGMFAMVLLGLLISQRVPTSYEMASSQTVFGAEAGVNAVVGQIRNAAAPPDVTNTVYGDRAKLPCTAQGKVAGASGPVTYDAQVQYFVTDPTDQTDAWRAANALSCTPGSGPSADPAFAVITSSGSGSAVAGLSTGAEERTVQVVYEFQVTNNNIPGGLIYSWDQTITPDRFCLQADAPIAGSYISYVPAADCGTRENVQLWLYDTDYQIKLASTTVPTSGVDPLCITGTPSPYGPVRATLEVCKADSDASRWNQLWSWEGGAHWRGQQNPISAGYSNYWLSSGINSGAPSGRDLYVWNQAAQNAEWGSFDPDARVGAGAAGYNTHQLVNYLEFGRCADVTHQNVNEPEMIAYPCKQDPDPSQSQLNWNHKWYYNEPVSNVGSLGPQQLYVRQYDTTKYCLVSPGTEGGHVTFTNACNTSSPSQKWTRYADTGVYSTSYTLVDGYGRCLDLGAWYKLGTSSVEPWSTMVTTTCNGTLGQKWNAPPNTVSASLEGYWELP